ncbi:MAG: hypothetical protein H7328_09570 [Bdellovibrio sp.]|nr:hypothetical protein [Bdellovibrio sp.]
MEKTNPSASKKRHTDVEILNRKLKFADNPAVWGEFKIDSGPKKIGPKSQYCTKQ